MILSMTGYGKAENNFQDKKIIVEIRSLNSKQLDLSMRVAAAYREKELDLRSLVSTRLERGKVDMAVYTQSSTDQPTEYAPINAEAFTYYYKQLSELTASLGIQNNDLVSSIMRMPDVTKSVDTTELSDEEWEMLQNTVNQALEQFVAFRTQEGLALQNMFTEKLDGIMNLLAQVEPFEKGRIEKIRQHLEDNLDKLSKKNKQAIDTNRLEQEMIYYLEKLDITEEKVRLTNHVRYFRETMDLSGAGVGKKLGFIAQEMGREINTLGSKSNQSEMQIIVVKMKDILEQIKEQVLNVL